MAISGDYPTPVMVNGFACNNCTDVDNAKKHIDPAHPKDGPYGALAAPDARAERPGAVALAGASSAPGQPPPRSLGLRVDVFA